MTDQSSRWFIARTRYIPALWPASAYFNWPVHTYLGVPTTGYAFHIFDRGECTAVWEEATLQAMSQRMLEIVSAKISELDGLRAQGLKSGEAVVAFTKSFADRAADASVADFGQFLAEFSPQYNQFMRDNMLYWFLSSLRLEKEIQAELAAYAETDRQEIFKMMSLTTASYSHVEEQEFAGVVRIAQAEGIKSANARAAIKEFSAKYFWFPYEYIGPNIWDEAAVAKRVQEHLGDTLEAHMSRDVAADQSACATKYQLSPALQDKFAILRTMTLMQDDRKMINAQTCYYLNGVIMAALADKLGVSLEEARYIDCNLLTRFASEPEAVRGELRERTVFCVGLHLDGSEEFYSGAAAQSKLRELGAPNITDHDAVTEIKGNTANPGKVTGRVRVLRTSHVDDFQVGDIIVTGMTTPDFAPLMKKAAAIITNEGGITCHAAIVSRELNKPCIIGTKIATKVLKDGMMIEVDAEKGIVKILK